MTQSNFQGKAQPPPPPQPCGFKIQPPGSHCQLALSLGFVTVLALTSSPFKVGPPHWLGHGLRPCPSANLAGQLLPNPGRYIYLDLSKRAPKMLRLTILPRRFYQGESANLARIQFFFSLPLSLLLFGPLFSLWRKFRLVASIDGLILRR